MKWAFLVMLLAAGCGSDSSGDSAVPAPTVASALLLVGVCSKAEADFGCRAVGAAKASDDNYDKTAYALVWTWSLGAFAPACTAENTTEMPDGVFTFSPNLAFGAIVTGRACILTRSSGTYDAGKETTPATTPEL